MTLTQSNIHRITVKKVGCVWKRLFLPLLKYKNVLTSIGHHSSNSYRNTAFRHLFVTDF